MYKNWKVDRVFELLVEHGIHMNEQDFADLAVAAADQAGMSTRDQSLFEQLLTAAVEERKSARGAKR